MSNSDLPTRAELPSSQRLLRSTAIAVVAAAAILVTVVLPAEYGIDPTGIGRPLGLTDMGELKAQLAAEAEAARVPPPASNPAPRSGLAGAVFARFVMGSAAAQTAPPAPAAARTDETTITLRPNQGAEVKLEMRRGARATFTWTATGPVNFDLHGEPPNPGRNAAHSYRSGRGSSGEQGEITAIFDGTHGWFWRNRSTRDVTVTVRTSGDYARVIQP